MMYIRADRLDFDPRPQMARIFADGFYQWLKYFSEDKDKLGKAFEHIFNLRYFFVAIENGEILAQVSCADDSITSVSFEPRFLRTELGLVYGTIAYIMLKRNIIDRKYPFKLPANTGVIELVATYPSHQGKGIAHDLLAHVMDNTRYDDYVLEVADTNAAALRLCKKLGFNEFKRTAGPGRRGGFDYYLYMRKIKSLSVRV